MNFVFRNQHLSPLLRLLLRLDLIKGVLSRLFWTFLGSFRARIINSTITHTENSPPKLRGRYNVKFLRESKSKSVYDDFFHDTISELETPAKL